MPTSTPISGAIAAVFAHQGGWDEALLIILPLVALGGLLYLANRRADRRGSHGDETTEQSSAPAESLRVDTKASDPRS